MPDLLLNCSINYGVFLAIKPLLPLHFTLKVIDKVNAPIAYLNKSYMLIFIKHHHQH